MNKKVLAVFQNRTQALTFSRNLVKFSVKTKIVNTPRELTSSCGLSVEFDYINIKQARQCLLIGDNNSFSGFYIMGSGSGFKKYVRV